VRRTPHKVYIYACKIAAHHCFNGPVLASKQSVDFIRDLEVSKIDSNPPLPNPIKATKHALAKFVVKATKTIMG
jgi:hypothetical protein